MRKKGKLKEWFSMQLARNPGGVVLAAILLFNILFFIVAALIIDNLALPGTETLGFWESLYYSIMMVLDAGNAGTVVEMATHSKKILAVICVIIVIIGMVTFTGAVIGYVTNSISSFIDASNSGNHKLKIMDHLVILNWNTRASEIVNDLLFCQEPQKVVILTDSNKEEVKRELSERIQDTLRKENEKILKQSKELNWPESRFYFRKNKMRDNLSVIIREGDVYSSKQLHDISIKQARAVIILANDIINTVCKFEYRDRADEKAKGNPQTIKTLMQVADLTAAEDSADDQKIIVEVADEWTGKVVEKIIRYKQRIGKCNIIPLKINEVLGQILSQFCLMPELNKAYQELFSNQGATFQVEEKTVLDDDEYVSNYLPTHRLAIPLASLDSGGKHYFFYSACRESDLDKETPPSPASVSVKIDPDYWIEQKNVIILGHNSKNRELMKGFQSFYNEWNYRTDGKQILNIIVIDDEKSLQAMDNYREYPFVMETVAASIYDKEIIHDAIDTFLRKNNEDISILILSDDNVLQEDIDSKALANLVYVQEIISDRKLEEEDFKTDSIDIIVEIIDPKHHDVVNSYSVDNVVISNRYLSKMMTQIGEKEAIFDFYKDILTYDDFNDKEFESKEIYVKKVSSYFQELPKPCTAYQLVKAVWNASISSDLPADKRYPTILLGYVKAGGEVVLFDDKMSTERVALNPQDKIIVFTNH